MKEDVEEIYAKLSAYVDGELGPAERAEIEAHLAAHPSHAEIIEDMKEIRRILQGMPREASPGDLTEGLQSQLEREALLETGPDESAVIVVPLYGWRWRLAAAAIVLMAVGLGVMVYAFLPGRRPIVSIAPVATPEEKHGVAVADGVDKTKLATGKAVEKEAEDRGVVSKRGMPMAMKPAAIGRSEVATVDQLKSRRMDEEAGRELRAVNQATEMVRKDWKDSGVNGALAGVAAKAPAGNVNGPVVLTVNVEDPESASARILAYLSSNQIAWTEGDARLLGGMADADRNAGAGEFKQQAQHEEAIVAQIPATPPVASAPVAAQAAPALVAAQAAPAPVAGPAAPAIGGPMGATVMAAKMAYDSAAPKAEQSVAQADLAERRVASGYQMEARQEMAKAVARDATPTTRPGEPSQPNVEGTIAQSGLVRQANVGKGMGGFGDGGGQQLRSDVADSRKGPGQAAAGTRVILARNLNGRQFNELTGMLSRVDGRAEVLNKQAMAEAENLNEAGNLAVGQRMRSGGENDGMRAKSSVAQNKEEGYARFLNQPTTMMAGGRLGVREDGPVMFGLSEKWAATQPVAAEMQQQVAMDSKGDEAGFDCVILVQASGGEKVDVSRAEAKAAVAPAKPMTTAAGAAEPASRPADARMNEAPAASQPAK